MIKYCNKCKSKKDISLFYNCNSKKDGKSSNCKKCDDWAKDSWRIKNPEKVKAYELKRWRSGKKRKDDLARTRKHRVEMSDSYIRELITKKYKNLEANDIPKDLVDIYKMNLAIKRILKLTPKLKGEEGQP